MVPGKLDIRLEKKTPESLDFTGDSGDASGIPGAIRTRGLPLRRRMLYPAELRRHTAFVFYYPSPTLSTRKSTENRKKCTQALAFRHISAYNIKVGEFILPKERFFESFFPLQGKKPRNAAIIARVALAGTSCVSPVSRQQENAFPPLHLPAPKKSCGFSGQSSFHFNRGSFTMR